MLLLALAAPALAQPAMPPIGHPGIPGRRPLHERLAGADLVAVVRVERIDAGRIAVTRQDLLAGKAPEAFEVKRSPLRPPPLATGDRALLLLRGARPPYVLADEAAEVIRLSDDAMAARWTAAVRAVLAKREDPVALRAIYREWVENGPASLADLGAAGLRALDPDGPFGSLGSPSRLRGTSQASDGAAWNGIAE
jgi:hypothetical protein